MMMLSIALPGLTNFRKTNSTKENFANSLLAQSQAIFLASVVFPTPGSPLAKTLLAMFAFGKEETFGADPPVNQVLITSEFGVLITVY